jgi:hypothetical protein
MHAAPVDQRAFTAHADIRVESSVGKRHQPCCSEERYAIAIAESDNGSVLAALTAPNGPLPLRAVD